MKTTLSVILAALAISLVVTHAADDLGGFTLSSKSLIELKGTNEGSEKKPSGLRPIVTEALLKHYPAETSLEKLKDDLMLRGFPFLEAPDQPGPGFGGVGWFDLPEGRLYISARKTLASKDLVLEATPRFEPRPTPQEEAREAVKQARVDSTKSLAVVLPRWTPFGISEAEQGYYLKVYEAAYRRALVGIVGPTKELVVPRIGGGYLDYPSGIQGYTDGQAQALKDHPDIVEAQRKEYEAQLKKIP